MFSISGFYIVLRKDFFNNHLLCGCVFFFVLQRQPGLDFGVEPSETRWQLCRSGPKPGHLVQPPRYSAQHRWIDRRWIRIRHPYCHRRYHRSRSIIHHHYYSLRNLLLHHLSITTLYSNYYSFFSHDSSRNWTLVGDFPEFERDGSSCCRHIGHYSRHRRRMRSQRKKQYAQRSV